MNCRTLLPVSPSPSFTNRTPDARTRTCTSAAHPWISAWLSIHRHATLHGDSVPSRDARPNKLAACTGGKRSPNATATRPEREPPPTGLDEAT